MYKILCYLGIHFYKFSLESLKEDAPYSYGSWKNSLYIRKPVCKHCEETKSWKSYSKSKLI